MSMKKDKIGSAEIWLLVDSLLLGGIETHVAELATALSGMGQPVRVVLLKRYDARQPFVDKLAQLSIAHNFLSDLAPALPVVRQLLTAVAQYRPAVLHAHGYKASIYSRLAKLYVRSVMQVTTYHAGEQPTGRVWLYDCLDRYSGFLSDHCIAVSPAIQKKLPAASVLIDNFINIPAMTVLGQNKVFAADIPAQQIAFVGRLSYEKAPDRFVQLATHFPQESFAVYGEGEMAAELQPANNIHYFGFIAQMETYWKAIDILILPSRFEGLPMVMLEAMSRGIPVICMRVGAVERVITDDENGWIVDSMPQMQQMLAQWLQLPAAEKHHIREAAQQTIVKHFSSDAALPKILDCYRSTPKEIKMQP